MSEAPSLFPVYPFLMAYNSSNYIKHVQSIVELYKSVKQADIPDTFIIAKVFPKHGIFMSYRKWMYIKSMKPSEYTQPTLFN
jgi:hypothetical protein